MENNNIIGVLLIDLSAAFDIIDREVLLKTLDSYGFVESALQFISSYLCDGRQ